MFATDFEYADKRLSDFGFIMCHINTDSGIKEMDIGCDITFSTIKNNHSSIHYSTSSAYENVYTTSFEIIKNDCYYYDMDDHYLTTEEMHVLIKWLNRRKYNRLKFIGTIDGSENINYYGSFNVKQIMHCDQIIGLSLTFTANAPYGFGDTICFEYETSSNNETICLNGDGDEIGVVYPQISITFKKACSEFTIKNVTTGTSVVIKNCLSDETITMDGEHKIIITDKEDDHSTLYNDFNYRYLDINIDEYELSENCYTISSPCKIVFTYSPIRKIGVY